jgi:hypothetical protein
VSLQRHNPRGPGFLAAVCYLFVQWILQSRILNWRKNNSTRGRQLKEQAGFTLLKPMLVIAIIGIEYKQVASGKVDLRSRTRSQSG